VVVVAPKGSETRATIKVTRATAGRRRAME